MLIGLYFVFVIYLGSWNFECCELGNNDANWSDIGSLFEGV